MENDTPDTRGIMRSNLGKDYTVEPFQTQHAFIVGINNYRYVSPLKTAVNDATRLGEILADDHFHIVHPLCLNPTAVELRTFLMDMKTVVKEKDSVVFYFAGHGIALEDDKGMNGYIVPIVKRKKVVSCNFTVL